VFEWCPESLPGAEIASYTPTSGSYPRDAQLDCFRIADHPRVMNRVKNAKPLLPLTRHTTLATNLTFGCKPLDVPARLSVESLPRNSPIASAMAQLKKDWTPNPQAFRQFLNWLDEGVDSNGERYLEMRRRLGRYFDRRNCSSPGDLADETLNRVARKLEEKGEIVGATPAHYCYIVAKFVFLEFGRRSEHNQTSLDDNPGPAG